MATIRDLMIRLGVVADTEDGLDKAARSFDKFKVAAGAVGVAAGAALTKGIMDNMEIEAANDKLAAQLGANGPEAARLGKVAGELYAQAYGDSMDDVNSALKSVMQNISGMSTASDKDLQTVTASVMNLAQAFDHDLGETSVAVGQMLKTGMAANAQEAMDILTRGFQTGADKAGDLLDTFNEYGTQFRKVGLSGQEAMGLISQALQAGARDSDIAADAIKEFSIRAIDGSKSTAEGFTSLGLNWQTMASDMAAGGDRAKSAFDKTLDALRGVEDPVKRSAIAVQLFGTQAEDLGDALYAMDPSKAVNTLGQVGGAAQKMGDTLSDNATNKVEMMKRSMEQLVQQAVSSPGPLGQVAAGFVAFGEPALSAAGSVGMLAMSFGPLGVKALSAIGGVLTSLGAMAVSAATSTATVVAQIAIQGARWVWLGIQATAQAIRIAAAWLISMGPIGLIIAAVVALVALIVANWDKIKVAIGVAWDWVKEKTKAVWDWIVNAIKTAIDFVTKFFMPFAIVRLIIENWDKIKSVTENAWNFFVLVIKTGIQNAINAINFLASIPGKVAAWFGELKDAAIRKLAELIAWAAGIGSRLLDAMGRANQLLFNWGRDVIVGFWNGMVGMFNWLKNAIYNFFSSIMPDWVKDALGISSPSKVAMQWGNYTIAGFGIGFERGMGGVLKTASAAMTSLSDVMGAPVGPSFAMASPGAGYTSPTATSAYGAASPWSSGSGVVIQNMTLQFADDRDMYQKGQEFAEGLREYKRRGGVIPS